MNGSLRDRLLRGQVIPAHPLALDAHRRLDERRQRALTRYYLASGAGGVAVGVHTTQFAIREAGLLEPVLALAAEELQRAKSDPVKIGGICGATPQALAEAALLARLGYDAGLLSLAALSNAPEAQLIEHCREVANVLPIVGFYLQPDVGGRVLPYSFWRRLVEIDNLVAIKIAPFNRYRTLDVVRALAASGRTDLALYTGNDDHIVGDLVTPFEFDGRTLRIVGGLLGHWSVGTRCAVALLERCQREGATPELLRLGVQVTDCNAAYFDAANGYKGCIAGLHEVLRRQGLMEGLWCLDPEEGLSPGQREEIDRVTTAYPHLMDDAFIAQHRDDWLR